MRRDLRRENRNRRASRNSRIPRGIRAFGAAASIRAARILIKINTSSDMLPVRAKCSNLDRRLRLSAGARSWLNSRFHGIRKNFNSGVIFLNNAGKHGRSHRRYFTFLNPTRFVARTTTKIKTHKHTSYALSACVWKCCLRKRYYTISRSARSWILEFTASVNTEGDAGATVFSIPRGNSAKKWETCLNPFPTNL